MRLHAPSPVATASVPHKIVRLDPADFCTHGGGLGKRAQSQEQAGPEHPSPSSQIGLPGSPLRTQSWGLDPKKDSGPPSSPPHPFGAQNQPEQHTRPGNEEEALAQGTESPLAATSPTTTSASGAARK